MVGLVERMWNMINEYEILQINSKGNEWRRKRRWILLK